MRVLLRDGRIEAGILGLRNRKVTDGHDLDGKPRVRNSAVDMGCYEAPLGKGVMLILR